MSIQNVSDQPESHAIETEQAAVQKEIRRLRHELQERDAQLEAGNRAMDTFASTAAHDLRSRLSVIGAYAGLLEKNYANAMDERGAGYLKTIRRNVRQAGSLVNDLHAYSRWTRKPLAPETVNMDALVRAVVDDAVRLLPDGQAQPSISIGNLPPAHADAALLRQVWMHLVTNALKFSSRQAAPVITVSASAGDGVTTYSVRDNGTGFSMDHAGKLFEAFQRLHDSEEFEGSGLGLATVRNIVARHGGSVRAESREGEGALFSFALPGVTP